MCVKLKSITQRLMHQEN